MTPAGTSNELDVQNEWEENTHTHHTAKGDISLEQKKPYDIITDEEWYILVKVWDT